MKSQNLEILSYLKRGFTITPLQALAKFGCMRLAARIYDLKMLGHKILSVMIKIRNCWVKCYYMGGE